MSITALFSVRAWILGIFCVALFGLCAPLSAQEASFQQALAQAVAKDKSLSAYYEATGYKPLWVGRGNKVKQRVRALTRALDDAGDHGLPLQRYDLTGLQSATKSARTQADLATLEASYSKAFLSYARDVQSGILVPSRVVNGIERDAPRRDPVQTLIAFSKSSPSGFIKALPPGTDEYERLMDEKSRLERLVGRSAWGPELSSTPLKQGQAGPKVAALRARLAAIGYGRKSNANVYDDALVQEVAKFQRDHGMLPDGVAGKGTLAEINREPEERLASVIVAMERERWMNLPRGDRHIWVNIPDFTARIIDKGKTTFETRSVVGQNSGDRRSPEFSDVMEYMVINPTWNVPRSIAVKEYLPMMKQNPNAAGHLQLLDSNGRVVSRSSVNFASYDAGSFPYRLKEPPSSGNALGLVKFIFPNQYNIYLHDTPSKSLFGREVRAFSHGCIRLQDPKDFAYALLRKQTSDPQGFFQARLQTGRENTVQLETPVRVHIVYRTAFTEQKGPVQYRRDVYGRDASVFRALQKAGVSMRAVRS